MSAYRIQGATGAWEVVIGLEVHAQIATKAKLFSGASTEFGAPANTQASAVDLALPGTLPVLNRGAVERAIRFGLVIPTSNCVRVTSFTFPANLGGRPRNSCRPRSQILFAPPL